MSSNYRVLVKETVWREIYIADTIPEEAELRLLKGDVDTAFEWEEDGELEDFESMTPEQNDGLSTVIVFCDDRMAYQNGGNLRNKHYDSIVKNSKFIDENISL